jgi:chorismate mutase / prephenate dehydratase
MANRPSDVTAEHTAPVDPALAALRAQIDAVDAELLDALNRRARLAQSVGHLKHAQGMPVYHPEREAQVIKGLQAANPGPLHPEHLQAIWREVMSASRALEAPTRVAYLGPAGTFSEAAAIKLFGSSMAGEPCPSIDEVFRRVEAGGADLGVIPLENSTEGVVTRSLDLLMSGKLSILAETSLDVRHNLLRKTQGLQGIASVCAHAQALAQCQQWLALHLPLVERKAVSSNAEGARLASLDASVACLASDRAATQWGLHVLSPAVQDDTHNRTRFAVVADPAKHPTPKASGKDCTSLVVSVDNRPGAVHEMLSPLKAHGVSMSRLESRPARSGQWEYVFFIDLEGHPSQPSVAAAVEGLRRTSAFLRVLGSYPVS